MYVLMCAAACVALVYGVCWGVVWRRLRAVNRVTSFEISIPYFKDLSCEINRGHRLFEEVKEFIQESAANCEVHTYFGLPMRIYLWMEPSIYARLKRGEEVEQVLNIASDVIWDKDGTFILRPSDTNQATRLIGRLTQELLRRRLADIVAIAKTPDRVFADFLLHICWALRAAGIRPTKSLHEVINTAVLNLLLSVRRTREAPLALASLCQAGLVVEYYQPLDTVALVALNGLQKHARYASKEALRILPVWPRGVAPRGERVSGDGLAKWWLTNRDRVVATGILPRLSFTDRPNLAAKPRLSKIRKTLAEVGLISR